VNTLGDKLNKTHREKRTKYLEGFPASFDIVIVTERKLGNPVTHVFPATFPAHHPQAGAANPDAGEPDIDEMSRVFYTEWARMINRGDIKPIPHGMHGHSVDVEHVDAVCDPESPDELESANMTKDAVTKNTVCIVCGGLGHAAQVDGVGACLTKRLGHRVPHEHLSRIQYPDGYKPPRFLNARDTTPSSPRMTRNHRSNRDSPHNSNSARRFARSIECDTDTHDFEPGPSTTTAALQIAAEALQALRFKPGPKPRPRPNLRKPNKARVRIADSETEKSDDDADEEGDEAGLSVSFRDIEL